MKKPARVLPNQQLKQARVRQGWSQEYVAHEIGTDAFTVSRWERGVTQPSPHFRVQLCTLFHLNAIELGLVPQQVEDHTGVVLPDKTSLLDPAIPPLPAGAPGLIGRDALLRQTKELLLAEKHAALSALNGLPGVGKTALAIALAYDEEMRTHFADGILWAGLGRQPDILGHLSRWGAILNCAPVDLGQRSKLEAWAASIRAAIGQRRMLLVIDDAWKVADALALQIGGPHCAHLLTTRFPEIARRFAADGTTLVQELHTTDGRRLLMRLAPEVVQAEPHEAQMLVHAVGGLPLALTLLGNYLRTQAHSGQPRRIRAALERLHKSDQRLSLAEPQALIGTHPSLEVGTPLSLQTVIGLSVQQLGADARATLGALAVFPPKPNTFSEEAALEISAAPVEALDELSDAGLLESSGPGRYTLHQTITDYATSYLDQKAAVRRLAGYFAAYAEQSMLDYQSLDRESSNILAALEIAHTHSMPAVLVQGTHAFVPFLITRGLFPLAETLLQRTLAVAQAQADHAGQIAALFWLGQIAEQRSDYSSARKIWQDALALVRQHADIGGSARILRELGILAHLQGQPDQARQMLSEALEIQLQLGDQRGSAETRSKLAEVLSRQGQPEQARTLYTAALATFRHLGDQRGAAHVLGKLGVLAREQSQPDQARRCYEEGITILRQVGDQRQLAAQLVNLGNLIREQGQPDQARQFYTEALEINQLIENRRGFAFTLLNLGSLASDQGDFEKARQLYHEVLPIFRELQDQRSLAMTLQGLGDLEEAEGLLDLARTHLDESLALFRAIRDQRQFGLTAREAGTVARQQGRLDEAHALFEESLNILEHLGDQREVAVTRQEMGTLALQEGHLQKARLLLTEALETMRQMRDRRNVAHTLLEMGRLAWQEQRVEEALQALLGAGIGMKLMNWFEIAEVEKRLAQVRARLGEAAFVVAARQGEPEPAYELTRAEWAEGIQQLIANPAEAQVPRYE